MDLHFLHLDPVLQPLQADCLYFWPNSFPLINICTAISARSLAAAALVLWVAKLGFKNIMVAKYCVNFVGFVNFVGPGDE